MSHRRWELPWRITLQPWQQRHGRRSNAFNILGLRVIIIPQNVISWNCPVCAGLTGVSELQKEGTQSNIKCKPLNFLELFIHFQCDLTALPVLPQSWVQQPVHAQSCFAFSTDSGCVCGSTRCEHVSRWPCCSTPSYHKVSQRAGGRPPGWNICQQIDPAIDWHQQGVRCCRSLMGLWSADTIFLFVHSFPLCSGPPGGDGRKCTLTCDKQIRDEWSPSKWNSNEIIRHPRAQSLSS